MGSGWRKAKLALGLKSCVFIPRTQEDSIQSEDNDNRRLSDVATAGSKSPFFSPLISRSVSRSSKKTCSICLTSMKQRDGLAIFTAECSHSFHFQCIASNVKHGNYLCPICRAKWKEIPLQGPFLDPHPGRARVRPVDYPQNDPLMTVVRRLPRRSDIHRQMAQLLNAPEPGVFDDDEPIDHQPIPIENGSSNKSSPSVMEVKAFPEVSAAPYSKSYNNFSVLIHLKAPSAYTVQNPSLNQTNSTQDSQTPRAPVDLVTVLDISGSMAGTKLALLKRAMGFVIQNLGPSDRLAVIAFSSTARRLFPLRRMSDSGRQSALQAVNSLVANGGTNIAEGLRKGTKVMEERREKNSVASIILLSDGQDTYTVSSSNGGQTSPDYHLLLPLSICGAEGKGYHIPVHTFGFGSDHDASSMHSISEITGGTFSFIETESVIQDAFAQCIGGLLSVMVQQLQVDIKSVNPNICIRSLKAGSYPSQILSDGRTAYIDVGDLYADEQRDFLVLVNVPAENSSTLTSLVKVKCAYKDPFTKEIFSSEGEDVRIERPEAAGEEAVSIEVDRQQNRLQAADAMAEARTAAEQGNLAGALSILETCRRNLSKTVSAKSGDRLCIALDAELKEMQERVTSRQVYEASGRAYILSGLSSHSWQRATARGDSTDSSSLIQSYQTPTMFDMVTRSQALLPGTSTVPSHT
ncbi:von Willebrand factor, type A [Dillenia turbinata]|uniref:von Willebrand factor, type A n=1 Tax=Dillenia turbinata TaxID=194707 RepID=A0AAN8VFV2_9MAGN